MSPDIARLLDAAARVQAGEALTTDLLADSGLPVDLRLLVAATALAAADQPVTKLSMTASAPAARSARVPRRQRPDGEVEGRPAGPGTRTARLGATRDQRAQLAAELEKANNTIAEERARREAAELELEHVANYAREPHWLLKPEYEAALRERTEKVRPLRPVPTPDPGE